MLSELHNLNLKLCSKQYNKKFVLHLIVVPQLSSGRRHNYSTNTRQAGRANEQSMYSLMSMVVIQLIPNHSNRRSTVHWYFPHLVFPVFQLAGNRSFPCCPIKNLSCLATPSGPEGLMLSGNSWDQSYQTFFSPFPGK